MTKMCEITNSQIIFAIPKITLSYLIYLRYCWKEESEIILELSVFVLAVICCMVLDWRNEV